MTFERLNSFLADSIKYGVRVNEIELERRDVQDLWDHAYILTYPTFSKRGTNMEAKHEDLFSGKANYISAYGEVRIMVKDPLEIGVSK